MIKIGLVSLGCAKNLVDSEMILGMFSKDYFEITNDPKNADLIIVNTCGFIDSAKRESIDTIMEMARYKRKIAVVGCLAERYYEDLKSSLTEADLIVPIRNYKELHKYLLELLKMKEGINEIDPLKRVVSTPSFSAYLRISEGCNNFCAFCAIPYIRGRFVSRPFDEVIAEAKLLKSQGFAEISIISQDTTNYGSDFKDKKITIVDLLREIDNLGFKSIRLLYLFPDEISDDLIALIKNSKSIAHYFDIPIQAGSDKVLKLMRRKGDTACIRNIISKIKKEIPDVILRTTLIAGFPGESKKDHEQTIQLLKDLEFDHAGAFAYSREEGTTAFYLPHQCREKTKQIRRDEIMKLCSQISYKKNKEMIGREMEGFIVGYNKSNNKYLVRTYWNAPDDVDGNIYLSTTKCFKVGEIVKIKIVNAFVYDLLAELA